MKKYLTYEEAMSLLPNEKEIHTFYNCSFGLLGADWRKEEVLELLKNPCTTIELTGENAKAMKHGMCAYRKGERDHSLIVFIETDDEKLSAFEQEHSTKKGETDNA